MTFKSHSLRAGQFGSAPSRPAKVAALEAELEAARKTLADLD